MGWKIIAIIAVEITHISHGAALSMVLEVWKSIKCATSDRIGKAEERRLRV